MSANTRRSISGIGLVSNIIPPIPDGSISDSNSDGSDLRHIAGYNRTIWGNPIFGVLNNMQCVATLEVAADVIISISTSIFASTNYISSLVLFNVNLKNNIITINKYINRITNLNSSI
jgi:hypothetical protein